MASQDFNFNGRNASEFGIKIERFRSLSRPSRKFNASNVQGRNGNIYALSDVWEESVLTYEIYATDTTADASTIITDIMEWLTEPNGYAVLTDTYDPEHYRLAMFLDETDIENIYNKFGRASLRFRCLPERFLMVSDIEAEFSNNQIVVTNPTNHNSKPLISFTGTTLTTLMDSRRTRITTPGGLEQFSKMYTVDNLAFDKLCYVGMYYNCKYIQSSKITNLSLLGNSITFTPTEANVGIGLPINVDPNSAYSFDYDLTYGLKLSFFEYTETGLFIREIFPKLGTTNLYVETGKNVGFLMLVFYGQTANVEVSTPYVMIAEGDTLPAQASWETTLPLLPTYYKILTVGANVLYTFNRKFNDITIDTENETVYNNGTSINRYIKIANEGNGGYTFLNLLPGDNTIRRESNATVATLELVPNFWEI